MRVSILFTISITILFIGCNGSNIQSDRPEPVESDKEVYQMNEAKLKAVDANNLISSIQKSSLDLVDSLFRANAETLESKMSILLFELEVNESRLKEIEGLPKVEPFIASVLALIDFYRSEVETNFSALLPILNKTEKTDEDYQVLEAYDAKFVKKEADLFQAIVEAQEQFAQENSIVLTN